MIEKRQSYREKRYIESDFQDSGLHKQNVKFVTGLLLSYLVLLFSNVNFAWSEPLGNCLCACVAQKLFVSGKCLVALRRSKRRVPLPELAN